MSTTTTTTANGSLEVFSSILAIVLQGEKTFWLGLQTKVRPLEQGWKGTNVFWLYPFEGDVKQFAGVPDFDITDSVYVLDRSAHSRVEKYATLVIDVQGRRYVKDRVEYFFVSCSEIKRLQELYRLFLKHELAAPPPPATAAPEAAPSDSTSEPHASTETDKILRVKETRTNKEVAVRVKETLERKEATPPPPKRAAEQTQKKSDHCNTEVFHWPQLFLVPQRGAIYLCPAEKDNTYGFRLHKVTMSDAVSLLMFERTAPSSESVDAQRIGTAVHDKAVAETQLGKRVLTVTPSVWPLPDDTTAAKRPRPSEVAPAVEPTKKAKESAVPVPPPPQAAAAPVAGGVTPKESPPKTDALQAVGVNCWSSVQRAVPPVAELAKQHAFDANPTAPLQTAVFADGVAVTYSPAVATKVAPAPAVNGGAEKKARKAGGHTTTGSAVDEDMRDLLQHIQLAKEQAKV